MSTSERPTLRTVATRAGVSLGTASGVLSGKGSASAHTRQLVLTAAEQLGYRRPRRIQASSPLQTIGVLARPMHYPNQGNPFYVAVLYGAQRAAAKCGITLAYEAMDDTVSDLPLLVHRRQVDGLLILGMLDPLYLQQLVATGLPCVIVDHAVDQPTVDSVHSDDIHGGYLATRHLLDLGHTDPIPAMIVGAEELVPVAERHVGYERALTEYGLTPSPHYLGQAGDLSYDGGVRAMRALLELSAPPTAVFCCNDSTALGALSVLRDRGITVPDKLSIIGYDDIELAGQSVPPLTSVAVDKGLLGAQGVWHLLQRAEAPGMTRRDTRLAVSLRERDSTGIRP